MDPDEALSQAIGEIDRLTEQLASVKAANATLEERLANFKRAGAGYQCQCARYEAEIEYLRAKWRECSDQLDKFTKGATL